MKDDVFEHLKGALLDALDALEPAPYPPAETKAFEYVTFDVEKDNTQWRELIAPHLAAAKSFEIHCWVDETEEIALALEYGAEQSTDWKNGRVIAGDVTPAFREMVLTLPKPTDRASGYNKMTPFFDIILDNGFTSAHYGTENHIPT